MSTYQIKLTPATILNSIVRNETLRTLLKISEYFQINSKDILKFTAGNLSLTQSILKQRQEILEEAPRLLLSESFLSYIFIVNLF